MQNFEVAKIVAQAATDIDEVNRDRRMIFVIVVNFLHFMAQMIAGNRAVEIYGEDE